MREDVEDYTLSSGTCDMYVYMFRSAAGTLCHLKVF